jgi:hypothetical protein
MQRGRSLRHAPSARTTAPHPDNAFVAYPLCRTRGRVDSTDGRKAFISGALVDENDTLAAEAQALMVRLLPGDVVAAPLILPAHACECDRDNARRVE